MGGERDARKDLFPANEMPMDSGAENWPMRRLPLFFAARRWSRGVEMRVDANFAWRKFA